MVNNKSYIVYRHTTPNGKMYVGITSVGNNRWHGGSGYYVSNGAMQKITWSKKNESSRLMLYDEDRNELVLNRGKSYIAVNYIGEATFE